MRTAGKLCLTLFYLTFASIAWSGMGLDPASPGLPAGLAAASAMCVDCHTNSPMPTSGTHFIVHNDGTAVRNTNNISWEFTGAWAVSTALSKYGAQVSGSMPVANVTAQTGDLICESCHNLVLNVEGGNNLLASYGKTGTDALCAGCHATQAGGPPNHHPMTGQNVGPDTNNPVAHTLSTTHTSHVKSTPVTGSDVSYPGVDMMGCAACHRPHGAAQGPGARIIRKGYSASTAYPGLQVNLVYTADIPQAGDVAGTIKIWNTGDTTIGIDRQSDLTAKYPGLNFRMLSNADPLCDSCHAK